jgi:hypothetical protein
MNTGKIIFEQLQVRKQDLWCWGATAFKTFSDTFFTDIPHLGGLVFKVNGLKHKQQVMIRLSPNDTYTVEIGTLRKGVWTTKETHTHVYDDMLHEVIDDMVEGTLNMNSADKKEAYSKVSLF